MKRKKRINKDRPRRGIYILPNIFTSLNIFCGFYAIIASIEGKYVTSAIAIIIAVIFDILDNSNIDPSSLRPFFNNFLALFFIVIYSFKLLKLLVWY